MSDPKLLAKIEKGRLKRLLEEKRSDEAVVEEMFLATLSRFPDEQERKAAAEHVAATADKIKAYVDVVWALLNTREFILNH